MKGGATPPPATRFDYSRLVDYERTTYSGALAIIQYLAAQQDRETSRQARAHRYRLSCGDKDYLPAGFLVRFPSTFSKRGMVRTGLSTLHQKTEKKIWQTSSRSLPASGSRLTSPAQKPGSTQLLVRDNVR
jgi:hypothetical protein